MTGYDPGYNTARHHEPTRNPVPDGTNDPLYETDEEFFARLAAIARDWRYGRDVLALVEIAKDMERIAEQQSKTLDWLQANGIVFDNLDDHWQKVAFSIYTDLCETDTIARAALARLDSNT